MFDKIDSREQHEYHDTTTTTRRRPIAANASPLYVAGQRVAAGVYRRQDGRVELRLDKEDVLPASLDGRVSVYERVQPWGAVALSGEDGAKENTRS
jgi:hypothetical protein